MAENQPTTVFDIPTLNAIGTRLSGHADAIANAAWADIAADLQMAAMVCSKLASLRFRIAEIAEAALAHPEWDRAAFARDLRDTLLKNAEGGGDLPEPNRASHFS